MDPPRTRSFATTHWSLVLEAARGTAEGGRQRDALEALCRAYWYPLYAFTRRRGHAPADAEDLIQAFFARIIETRGLAGVDADRGRFRSYLLGALKHFLANERDRRKALKRGGGVRLLEWEALSPETRFAAQQDGDPPEQQFDRAWALQTVDTALHSLQDEMAAAGKQDQFDALRGCLSGEGPDRNALAEQLGMTPGAVKVAIHRLRARYREALRQVIAQTVTDEADLEDEMRYLVSVLRKN